jgi:hypothetical protein
MLRRARGTLPALAFGSAVAAGLVFGMACSVDRAGLSNNDASVSTGGSTGGTLSTGGSGGGPGLGGSSGNSGAAGGSGGPSPVGAGGVGSQAGGDGGSGPTGAGGAGGTSGLAGASGGATGAGGATGEGGATGTGGATGDGGATGTAGATGDGGATGTGGATGEGGATGAGGAPGDGGASGTGGATGDGGASGTGGATGDGGTSGAGGNHPPSCSSFPAGSSFTTPTDGLLHCYWVHGVPTDGNSAEASCVSEGGTLATVLSSQENMFVLSVLLQAKVFTGNGVSLGATDGKATDDKSGAGKYAWVTGEPWGFQNWHSTQPDGSCTCQGNNSCTCDHWLAMISDGTWYDRPESEARPYLCEAIAR